MLNLISSSKVKKILNALLEGEKTLTEISGHLGISKPATIKYLNEMEKIGMISSLTVSTNIGREKKFNISPFSFVFTVDPEKGSIIYKNEESLYIKNPLLGQIQQYEYRQVLNTYLSGIDAGIEFDCTVVLFGSIARGEGTAKSDIDMLLIRNKDWNNKAKEAIMDTLHEGSIETQTQAKPIFLQIENFLEKKDNLTKRIKKEGLILYDSIGDVRLWKTMKRYWDITD